MHWSVRCVPFLSEVNWRAGDIWTLKMSLKTLLQFRLQLSPLSFVPTAELPAWKQQQFSHSCGRGHLEVSWAAAGAKCTRLVLMRGEAFSGARSRRLHSSFSRKIQYVAVVISNYSDWVGVRWLTLWTYFPAWRRVKAAKDNSRWWSTSLLHSSVCRNCVFACATPSCHKRRVWECCRFLFFFFTSALHREGGTQPMWPLRKEEITWSRFVIRVLVSAECVLADLADIWAGCITAANALYVFGRAEPLAASMSLSFFL